MVFTTLYKPAKQRNQCLVQPHVLSGAPCFVSLSCSPWKRPPRDYQVSDQVTPLFYFPQPPKPKREDFQHLHWAFHIMSIRVWRMWLNLPSDFGAFQSLGKMGSSAIRGYKHLKALPVFRNVEKTDPWRSASKCAMEASQWLLKGHNTDFLPDARVIVTKALQRAPGAVCTQDEFVLGPCALTAGCGGHKQAWTP